MVNKNSYKQLQDQNEDEDDIIDFGFLRPEEEDEGDQNDPENVIDCDIIENE